MKRIKLQEDRRVADPFTGKVSEYKAGESVEVTEIVAAAIEANKSKHAEDPPAAPPEKTPEGEKIVNVGISEDGFVSITTENPHGLKKKQKMVVVAGFTDKDWNGNHQIFEIVNKETFAVAIPEIAGVALILPELNGKEVVID